MFYYSLLSKLIENNAIVFENASFELKVFNSKRTRRTDWTGSEISSYHIHADTTCQILKYDYCYISFSIVTFPLRYLSLIILFEENCIDIHLITKQHYNSKFVPDLYSLNL